MGDRKGTHLDGRGGGRAERKRGRKTYNQDILCEVKNMFSTQNKGGKCVHYKHKF